MSLVLANIDADFRKPYVLNGFENVGSTETMVVGRHKSQNVGCIMFLYVQESYHFRLSARATRAAPQTQEIDAFR